MGTVGAYPNFLEDCKALRLTVEMVKLINRKTDQTKKKRANGLLYHRQKRAKGFMAIFDHFKNIHESQLQFNLDHIPQVLLRDWLKIWAKAFFCDFVNGFVDRRGECNSPGEV